MVLSLGENHYLFNQSYMSDLFVVFNSVHFFGKQDSLLFSPISVKSSYVCDFFVLL